MALGKSRNSKRSSSSSSSSYGSTITMVVFLGLCVLAIWMLTSNSVTPPQNASDNIATSTSTQEDESTTRSDVKKDSSAFEDNPGDLPDDAIKSDDHREESKDDMSKSQPEDQKLDSLPGDSKDPNVVNYAVDGVNEKQESSQDLQEKESSKEQEKQKENEKQISEESSFTENQLEAVESQKMGKEETDQGNQKVDESTNTKTQSQESENQMPNEDQQQQQSFESQENKNPSEPQNQIPSGDQEQRLQQQKSEDESSQESKNDEGQIQEKQKEDTEKKEENHEVPQKQQTQQEFQDETNEVPKESHEVDENQESEQNKGETQEVQLQEENSSIQEAKEEKTESKSVDLNAGEAFPGGGNTGIPKESKESKKSWSTQAAQSENEKERRKDESNVIGSIYGYTWHLCNVTAGTDYIPCLDNEKALKKLRTTKHFEHRERHCPEEGPMCLVPPPEWYKTPIMWPKSRDKIWYHNVPHAKLAEVKGHQNWVKVTGEFLTFPGGGTQFIHGALHYIDFLQQSIPNIAWGKHTRVVLDVGCGVASFGGYLFERDVLTMSFAPKDEHEAQVQFALERGIPAISAVMGSQRLPFPSRVFDLVHCARCRVPWHAEGGMLLLELNRVLRPGGYFVWSATPVYQKLKEDVEIWKEMSSLTNSMCWELVTIKKDKLNSISAAIYRKPSSNNCYDQRKQKRPPMCKNDDDPNAAWHVPLQSCMHRVPVDEAERGTQWPEAWPRRLQTPPYWLNSSQMGIYGKPAPQDFAADHEHWKQVVSKSYVTSLGITWSNVRNVMDMRAVYGGFAAALKDLRVWVLNVVNIDSPDTLPIIYERGLFGIYHDWCESFSTYPRTYDLLHADHLFSKLKKRCKLAPVMVEVDRIVRPGGKLIVRDESSTIGEVENLLKSLHWEVHLTFSKNQEGMLSAQKGNWRPDTYVEPS
ncbi:probable methyltransferase PMT27 isoform X1 [Juglans microcarpa x Juglans regia]|uniref:probable methyltransferase PMT27 isoform X1 n=1 Tax=Juglans microcarpa x Juglans regia TaxID=2249226 RepID=UPI001B7E11B3|nr:probable methyltransferase PMT27 isoform X1 [Juglans microcarpa x Juglans regia]